MTESDAGNADPAANAATHDGNPIWKKTKKKKNVITLTYMNGDLNAGQVTQKTPQNQILQNFKRSFFFSSFYFFCRQAGWRVAQCRAEFIS